MTKREFIEELCKKLRYVSADEASRLVAFVCESIDDRMEEGMTEEEAVAAVGSIDDLVRELGGAETEAPRGPFAENTGTVRKDYVVTVENLSRVEVTVNSDDVAITPSGDGRIHVHVTENEHQRYRVMKKGGVLSVAKELREQSVNFGFGLFSFRGLLDKSDNISLELPENLVADVAVKTGSGNIACLCRSAASLKLASGSGDVKVQSASAYREIEIATASGDVDARELMCDSVVIGVASGDVEIASVTANNLRISSASGDLDVRGAFVRDRVQMKSASGDVELKMESPLRDGVFESVSGDAELTLYGFGESYALNLSTVSGTIEAPDSDAAAVNAVRVRTTSGDIRVKIAR